MYSERACCLQFFHLQQDYEYNLELLDGRDAELERYDKEFDAVKQELASKEQLVAQLRTALTQAESGAEHMMTGSAERTQQQPEQPLAVVPTAVHHASQLPS